MKKYTNTLLGVVAIVGMSASSSAFADSIHHALEKSRVSSETVEVKATTGKSESTPWTINDYVGKHRGVEVKATTANSEAAPWTINDYVKKYRGLSKRRTA